MLRAIEPDKKTGSAIINIPHTENLAIPGGAVFDFFCQILLENSGDWGNGGFFRLPNLYEPGKTGITWQAARKKVEKNLKKR